MTEKMLTSLLKSTGLDCDRLNRILYQSPVLEALNKINRVLYQPPTLEFFKLVNQINIAWNHHATLLANQFMEPFSRIQAICLQFETILKSFTIKQQQLVENCIAEGWYPFPGVTFCGNSENFEKDIAEAIENCMPEIEEILSENYPNRARCFQLAFSAHNRGEYELSISCLFPQAEGICTDILGFSPFATRGAGERLEKKLQQEGDMDFLKLYFKPLLVMEDIRNYSNEVSEEMLNRHAVMHGRTTTCFTKINSLKLISFLASLDWLLSVLRQE